MVCILLPGDACDQPTAGSARPAASQDRQRLLIYFVLAFLDGADIYVGMANFGYGWLLPVVAAVAYLAADLLSGVVHFLADNFGSAETPVIGPNFIGAFREHHVDPKGITTHDFIDTNGNNSLASLPFMGMAWIVVPVETTVAGYLFGAFCLMVCFAPFLTNRPHPSTGSNVGV